MSALYAELGRAALAVEKSGGLQWVSVPGSMKAACSIGDALLLGPDWNGGPLYKVTGRSTLAPLTHQQANVSSIAGHARLILLCSFDRLMRSTDGGASFHKVPVHGHLAGVARASDGTVWLARCGDGPSEVGYSSDDGMTFTWQALSVEGLPVHFAQTNKGLVLCCFEHVIFIEKRRLRPVLVRRNERIDAVMQTSSGAILAIGGGVYRSEDGNRWRKSGGPIRCGSCAVETGDGAIYIANEKRAVRSRPTMRALSSCRPQLPIEMTAAARHGNAAVFVGGSDLLWIGSPRTREPSAAASSATGARSQEARMC